ncbi:MAG: Ig-like domain-containing protein, partial [Pseudomonadota bacterium]
MLRLACSLTLLTTLLVLVGCGDGTGDPDAPLSFASELVALEAPAGVTGFVPTLEGPLRVLSASPFGAMAGLAPNQAISVTFSRPMVPLGRTPEPAAEALTLRGPDGPVAGTLRWQGTQTLVFQPDSLVPATPYTATLAAGLASVEEEALANPYTWTFQTPRPVLLASEPARNADYADPEAPIRLFFSLPVEADAVRRFIELRNASGSRLDVRVEQAGDSSIVVTPRTDLAKGSSYNVRVSTEMPAAVGTLGIAEAVEFNFRTYGDFGLRSVGQRYRNEPYAPDRALTLTFTTPVRFEALRQAMSFSPAVELPAGIEARDAVESTEHSLRLPLDPETQYTLTLDDGLRDVFDQRIGNRISVFRTAALTPTLRMPTGLLVIEADRDRAVPLRVTNIDAVNVGFERFTPADLIRKLPAYDDRHWYGPFPEGYEAPEPVAASRRVPLTIDRNRPTYVPLALDSLLDGENGGLVGVHLRYQQGGNERVHVALAQVTTLGLTAKFSPHQNLFFVTTLADAQPVEGAAVTVYDDAGNELWQGTSNARGIVQSPGWAALGLEKRERWETPVQYAFVEHEGQVAFTSSRFDDGIEPYRFDIDLDWSPEPLTYAGTVFSDRGLYRAGETAH